MKQDEAAIEFEIGALVSSASSSRRATAAGVSPDADGAPPPPADARGSGGRRRRRVVAWAVPLVIVAGLVGAAAYVAHARENAAVEETRFSDLSAPPTLALTVGLDELGEPVSPVETGELPSVAYVGGKLVISITNGRQLAAGEYSSTSGEVHEYSLGDGETERWEVLSTALRVVSAGDLTPAWEDEWPYGTGVNSFNGMGYLVAEPTADGSELTVRSWSDGHDLARLPVSGDPVESITSNAQVAVVTQPEGLEHCRATAFDLPALTKRWEIQLEQRCVGTSGLRYLDLPAAELIPVPMESNLLINWVTGTVVHDDMNTWAIPIDSEHFVVMGGRSDSSGLAATTVYAADGRKLFTLENAGWLSADRTDPSAPLIAMVAHEGDDRWNPQDWDIRGLDPWTGAERWSAAHAGYPLGVTNGVVLAASHSRTLMAFGAADGRQLWQTQVPPDEGVSLIGSDSDAALVVYSRYTDGVTSQTMAAFDLASGAELWRQPLSPNSAVVAAPDHNTVFTVDDDEVQAWRLSGR